MYEVWTYRDAVDHVLDAFQSEQSPRNQRNARRAVLEAYRDIAEHRVWSYFNRRGSVTTVASQSTGTITYVHSTRTVTLTGATFPTNARYYELIISGIRYDIDTYVDSTHVTLTVASNPGADISTDTTYLLYRDTYPLPDDFMQMGTLVDATNSGRPMQLVSVDFILRSNRSVRSAGIPLFYAVTKVAENQGGLGIIFSPTPNSARTFDFMYQARPRALQTEMYCTGLASVTSGSADVTGNASTAWASKHAGCVLRLSADGVSLPTSLAGSPNNDLNPCAAQGVVYSVGGVSAITLAESATQTLSNVKYTLSDPLDLEPGAMHTAFLRMAELAYAIIGGREDASIRRKRAEEALYNACAADNRNNLPSEPLRGTGTLADIVASVGNG